MKNDRMLTQTVSHATSKNLKEFLFQCFKSVLYETSVKRLISKEDAAHINVGLLPVSFCTKHL